jgi:hypothetical protein
VAAIVPASLKALTLTPTEASAKSPWIAAIGNKTAGSTVSAVSSDGTVLQVNNTNGTVTGTFPAEVPGGVTVTLKENLAGSPNDGRETPLAVSVGPVASFGKDSFTDADGVAIASHVPEAGGSWSTLAGAAVIAGNALRQSGTSATLHANNGTPAAQNYKVKATLKALSVLPKQSALLAARIENASNFLMGGYRYDSSGSGWFLGYIRSGSTTTLQLNTTTPAPVAGASYELELRINGRAAELYLNGTLVASGTYIASSLVGLAGVRFANISGEPSSSNTTGYHFDTFDAAPL